MHSDLNTLWRYVAKFGTHWFGSNLLMQGGRSLVLQLEQFPRMRAQAVEVISRVQRTRARLP